MNESINKTFHLGCGQQFRFAIHKIKKTLLSMQVKIREKCSLNLTFIEKTLLLNPYRKRILKLQYHAEKSSLSTLVK